MYDISVIIPMYNVEDYIEECLSSLCKQKGVSCQVICIDDGSSDRTVEIVKTFFDKIEHLELYINDDSYGPGYSRNKGMDCAKGEYLLFLDSDDYFEEDVFSFLLDYVKKRDIDMLPFDAKMFSGIELRGTFDENMRIRKHIYREIEQGINIAAKLIQNGEMCSTVWGAIYKKSFLEKKEVRFIPGILHEDIPFAFEAMIKAERVCCIDRVIYYYRQRGGSIMHKLDYEKLLKGLILGCEHMETLVKARKEHCSEQELQIFEKYFDWRKELIKKDYLILLSNGQCISAEIEDYILNKKVLFEKETLEKYFSPEDIEKIQEEKMVSVYGAGNIARFIIYILKREGISVTQILVADTESNPPTLFDIPVCKWNQENNGTNLIVIAISKNIQQGILEEFKTSNVMKYIATSQY